MFELLLFNVTQKILLKDGIVKVKPDQSIRVNLGHSVSPECYQHWYRSVNWLASKTRHFADQPPFLVGVASVRCLE